MTEIIDLCTKSKIKLGFITTTSLKNINSIKTALLGKLDFSCFDIITSIEDVKNPKPNSEVYAFVLSELGLEKMMFMLLKILKQINLQQLNLV